MSLLIGVACTSATGCLAVGYSSPNHRNVVNHPSPATLAERWSGGRWRIQPTPGLVANDSGLEGVACPTASACFAVASYTNNGLNLPNLTLVEQWNQTGTNTQAATGRTVAAGVPPPACIRAGMPGSHPSSGRIPAAAWPRFRVGGFLSRAGSPSPESRIWCGAG
jgi:hypothetical protein